MIKTLLMVKSISELERRRKSIDTEKAFMGNDKVNVEKIYLRIFALEQNILESHYNKLQAIDEFNALYQAEKKLRYSLKDKIYHGENISDIKLFAELIYDSKESMFQFRDSDHLKQWIAAVETLREQVDDKSLIGLIGRYKVISQKIKDLILQINESESMLDRNMLQYNHYLVIADREINLFQFEQQALIDSVVANINLELFIMLMIFTLSLYAMIYYLRNALIKPIENLRDKSKYIYESKVLSEIKGFESKDEIGELGQYFNLMIKQLRDLYSCLEDKVNKKTADLKCINLSLRAEIAQRIKLEEKLEKQAITDELTGCFNRRAAYLFLDIELKKAKRYAYKLTIVYIDLDNLKEINDTLGHAKGDKYITDFVDLTMHHLRGEDYFCRVGGDEFLLIFNNLNEKETKEVIESRIAPQLRSEINLQFSYGLTEVTSLPTSSIDQLISDADEKMYQDKRRKKSVA
ncbi:GGDEF domain-containing protein [Psychromonas antarctica]|uniref:GGDEF domain-containing protein n=1 Tax=Psychromonas antarctica TaxID=67573 RepID=UPI001EE7A12E|nr:GGDEF domain-containing protein [Psychromonas antarctica]